MEHFWASFQTSRKRVRKLQEAIGLNEINKAFKFPPHFDSFGAQMYHFWVGYFGYPEKRSYK